MAYFYNPTYFNNRYLGCGFASIHIAVHNIKNLMATYICWLAWCKQTNSSVSDILTLMCVLLFLLIYGHTERRDSTQTDCFVESRRRSGHIKRRDSTKLFVEMSQVVAMVTPNCLIESSLSVRPCSRSDSTSHDQFLPVLQIRNIFSFDQFSWVGS